MKFEMVSGDESLFAGAPDWATMLTKTGGFRFFVEEQKAGARIFNIDSRFETNITEWLMPYQFYGIEIIAERRPIIEWNGEGLPPVGVECEMQASTGPWIPVHIIANYDGFSFGWNYDSRLTLFSDDAKSFRPIRSPQEIARG